MSLDGTRWSEKIHFLLYRFKSVRFLNTARDINIHYTLPMDQYDQVLQCLPFHLYHLKHYFSVSYLSSNFRVFTAKFLHR